MKHEFLKREGNDALVLFFSGWGGAPELFSSYDIEEGHDCLLCYDYKDLAFDMKLIDGYRSVKVVAWSMGVWVADAVCGVMDGVGWDGAVAFGGTLFPIDDHKGIPVAIFDGTLENMSAPVLHKFRRRMCGRDLEHFMGHIPGRDLDDLTAELSAIRDMVHGCRAPRAGKFRWTRAVAGREDLIFPFGNQCNAWEEAGVPVSGVSSAHYDHNLFAMLLGGREIER